MNSKKMNLNDEPSFAEERCLKHPLGLRVFFGGVIPNSYCDRIPGFEPSLAPVA